MKSLIRVTVNKELTYVNSDHVMSIRDVNGHAQIHMSNGSVMNCVESAENIAELWVAMKVQDKA